MLGAWLKKTGMQNRELYPDAIQKWNLNPVPHTHSTKCRFETLKVCPKNSQTILGSSKTWTCQQWTHHEFHSNFLVSVGSNTNGLSTEQETATAFQTKMLLNHLKPPSKGHANLMSIFGMGCDTEPCSRTNSVTSKLLVPTLEPRGFDNGKMPKDFQSRS